MSRPFPETGFEIGRSGYFYFSGVLHWVLIMRLVLPISAIPPSRYVPWIRMPILTIRL
jgi:hypothetical protein